MSDEKESLRETVFRLSNDKATLANRLSLAEERIAELEARIAVACMDGGYGGDLASGYVGWLNDALGDYLSNDCPDMYDQLVDELRGRIRDAMSGRQKVTT